jgi:hypothetical protein
LLSIERLLKKLTVPYRGVVIPFNGSVGVAIADSTVSW